METFRAYTYMDVYDRLNVVASTQVTFHVRRILAHALHTSKSKIRVIKPRIGGGFGAKQTVVMEMYPAIVTWKTGKPAMMIFSRYESMIASSPRHEMEAVSYTHLALLVLDTEVELYKAGRISPVSYTHLTGSM